ncbi:MAG: LysM peptidoglycan-binding domain-containing protein [Gemmatimonadota bacterium]|nr:LysM peptidoglycan-binding domain-containing protein [Gemmatimonadota bacterium]
MSETEIRAQRTTRTARQTAAAVLLAVLSGACATNPAPVNGPGPAAAGANGEPLEQIPTEPPAPLPLEADSLLVETVVEKVVEETLQPDPAPEAFEGPTDEEIDATLRELLGSDPVDVVRDPEEVENRLPLEMNDRVEAWINYFQNVIPDRFGLYLERKGRYEPMIREKLRDRGMPQDLIYLSLIESGMSPNAYSRAAAVGLWQFIRSTGRMYDLEVSFWVDERRDPELATEAALSYLSDLHDRFGSWYLAAAAYNGGPGRVSRGLARTGGGTFWDLADARLLRSETRNYVPKIIAAAMIGHDPERYGFERLVSDEPIEYEIVSVPDATSFDVLAEAAGTDEETIRDLNPQFPQKVTPPDRRVDLKVPDGSGERFQLAYVEIPEDERVTWTFHVVQRGHTLGWIGEAYGVSVTALRAANGNIDPRRLQVGQQLVIPRPARPAARSPQTGDPSESSSGDQSASASSASSSDVGGETRVEEQGTRTIVVQRGDSLWTIARRHSVSTSDLMRWNDLQSTVIKPGDRLQVGR